MASTMRIKRIKTAIRIQTHKSEGEEEAVEEIVKSKTVIVEAWVFEKNEVE